MALNLRLEDIDKLVQGARENAILGQYEKALTKYKYALDWINKHVNDISDSSVQDKWRGVEKGIKEEVDVICEILTFCETFKTVVEESGEKKSQNAGMANLDNLGDHPVNDSIQKNEEMLAKLQGRELPNRYRPRENNNNKEDLDFLKDVQQGLNQVGNMINKIESNSNNNNKNNNNSNSNNSNNNNNQGSGGQGGYNLNFAGLGNNRFNNNNNNKGNNRPSSNYNNNNNNRGGYGGGSGGGRVNPMNQINAALNNYQPSDKMYQKYGKLANYGPNGYMGGGGRGGSGQGSGKGGDKGKGGKNSGKSEFLLQHYPNGEGPDTELIEMLEREVVDTNPHVKFEDIAELDSAKKTLQEAVLLPLLIPDYFKGIRRPWRGVLLYGPPGTGKTLLAKALATQGQTTFFNVHSSSFASKWRGESEKLVRILFEMAHFYAPTTIFIDEIDSLCSKRGEGNEGDGSRRVKAEMLVQMDGASSNNSAGANEKTEDDKRKIVTVIAATNRPWDLDDALRRRLEKRVYIPLPNEKGRRQMFDINLKKIPLSNDLNYDELIKLTDGYSGADISNVCREAALMPMRRELIANKGRNVEELVSDPNFRRKIEAPISMTDLKAAIGNISKSVSKNDLETYAKWTKEFSSV